MGCRWLTVGMDNCLSLYWIIVGDSGSGFIGSSSENWIYTKRREQQCTRARSGGARGGGASLVPEFLDAPVLLRDLRLELVNASLGRLEDALDFRFVREG